MCMCLPKLNVDPACLGEMDEGPVSEVLQVHKAIRIELRALLRAASSLPDNEVPDSKGLFSLAERVFFLDRMDGEHLKAAKTRRRRTLKAEDVVLLQRLEQRCPGVSAYYRSGHREERSLFE